jgi:hypothetical protein
VLKIIYFSALLRYEIFLKDSSAPNLVTKNWTQNRIPQRIKINMTSTILFAWNNTKPKIRLIPLMIDSSRRASKPMGNASIPVTNAEKILTFFEAEAKLA